MSLRVVMMGASGAVGRQVVGALTDSRKIEALTLLNRRPLPDIAGVQHWPEIMALAAPGGK